MRLALLIGLLLSPVALAGTAYDIVKYGGAFAGAHGAFHVVADSQGAVAVAAGEADVVVFDRLVASRGSSITAINSQNQTWYELETPAPFAPSSRYFVPTPAPHAKLIRATIAAPSADGDRRHYAAELTYLVTTPATGVRVTVTASFDIETTSAHERNLWIGRLTPPTGYVEVDDELSKFERTIEGFPLRLSVTATRKYDGGAAMREVATVAVSNIREAAMPADGLLVPKNFRNQKPVIGAPGV